MDLPGSEIHLYFSSPEEIADPSLLLNYKTLLTDDELTQMSRLYFARHRHQYLVTRALIRTTLSDYFQVEPVDWRFGKNSYGKPEISFPENIGPVRFNLSHCEGLILCGVARDHDIGVDVENVQRSTQAAFENLSSYFSSTEIADLARLPPDQQKQRFFDYWTLKESYIKARGMGLAISLAKFSFLFESDHLNGFSTHPDLKDDATNWQFWRLLMAERYRIAVAVNSANDFTVSTFKSVPLQGIDPIQLAFL
jgi:4'-phosphopantetheinyl transferase